MRFRKPSGLLPSSNRHSGRGGVTRSGHQFRLSGSAILGISEVQPEVHQALRMTTEKGPPKLSLGPMPPVTFGSMELPRARLARFNGSASTIRADLWINLFESATNQLPEGRVHQLMFHLDGEALEWYAEDIAPISSGMQWIACRACFLARFGAIIENPILMPCDVDCCLQRLLLLTMQQR